MRFHPSTYSCMKLHLRGRIVVIIHNRGVRLSTGENRSYEGKFWERVYLLGEDDCWPWLGSFNRQGYGHLMVKGSMVSAHRLSWQMIFGNPPKNKPCILHRCDNPTCVNPKHLYAGTYSENAVDCVRRGRHPNKNKTHCPQGHAYDEENTYITPKGHRACKECVRESGRRWRARI